MKLTTREAAFKGRLIRQTNIREKDKVLDIGCGTATLTIGMKKACPRAKVTGLDGDPKILAIANKKAQRAGVEVEFVKALSVDMPFPDSHFDQVISSLFFHHLNRVSKEKTLLQIRRVLKSDGKLHIADWGTPANILTRAASRAIMLLDGAETTGDNFGGLLPRIIEDAGFYQVEETAAFNTAFGTIRILKATKGKD